jgi:hypothetical protein
MFQDCTGFVDASISLLARVFLGVMLAYTDIYKMDLIAPLRNICAKVQSRYFEIDERNQ